MTPYTGTRRVYLLALVVEPDGMARYVSLDLEEGTLEDALEAIAHHTDDVHIIATADEQEVQA